MTGRDIRPGEIIGERLDGDPEDEADHYAACPMCGAWFDMRDLAQVLAHAQPWPHERETKH